MKSLIIGQVMSKRICMLMMGLLACAVTSSAQSMKNIFHVAYFNIEGKWEIENGLYKCLNHYVHDYCDYLVFHEDGNTFKLHPGKNTIYKEDKNSELESQFKNPKSYRFYRGAFPVDFDIKFPYALPVKKGAKVRWLVDRRERVKTLNFKLSPGDTVYATRSGMACKAYDERILLTYHADRTFAAYVTMSKNFTVPGEPVSVGQPVGIAGPTGVSISFFFLDKNKFEGGDKMYYPYTHFMPVFRTSEGDIAPKAGVEYTSGLDDDLMMKEMTKRERKKYLNMKQTKKK